MLNLAAAQRILFPDQMKRLTCLQHAANADAKQVGSPGCPFFIQSVPNCLRFVAAFAVTFWVIWHFACRKSTNMYLIRLAPSPIHSLPFSLSIPSEPRSFSLLLASLLTHYFEINVASFARQAREFLLPSTWQPPFLLSFSVCLSCWLSTGYSFSH